MTDITSVIALAAQIIFCPDGPVNSLNMCPDGTFATRLSVNILERSKDGVAIVQFDQNDVPQLLIRTDGSITNPGGLKIDDAAHKFWMAISAAYPNYCTWALENNNGR